LSLFIDLAPSHFLTPLITQDKRHPATPFTPGRVRVVFKKANGEEVYPGINSKASLLKKVVEIIPTLKHRVDAAKALEQKQKQEQKELQQILGKKGGSGRRR